MFSFCGHFRYKFRIQMFFSFSLFEVSSIAMADRENSWDAFLCHGPIEVFKAPVPWSMLEASPENVRYSIPVAYNDRGSSICPRSLSSTNCNNRTNCPCHPDVINEHWVVPDLICHKWFRGVCDYPQTCWNQHGYHFEGAMRAAFRLRVTMRKGRPPVQFKSEDGGFLRHINRKDAARLP